MHDTYTLTKDELIDHTTLTWDEFVAFVDAQPDELWVTSSDPAGWTVKDHVSHVTQWDVAVVRLFGDGVPLQTTLVIPDDEWNFDYEAINERIRQRNLHDSVDTVKAERDKVWSDLLAALHSLTDAQLAAPAGEQGINVDAGDQSSLLRTLVDYQGGHYAAHLEYITRILEQENTE